MKSKEDKLEYHRKYSHEYYQRNKEIIKEKNKEQQKVRYHDSNDEFRQKKERI